MRIFYSLAFSLAYSFLAACVAGTTPESANTPVIVTNLTGTSPENGETVNLTARAEGTLTVEDGCTRLSGESSTSTIIWPEGTQLDSTSGQTMIVNQQLGRSVSVGDRIALTGATSPSVSALRLSGDITQRCQGPYFVANNFERAG